MSISLNDLVYDFDDHLFELATHAFARASGRPVTGPAPEAPAIARSTDLLFHLNSLIDSPKIDAEKRLRLEMLRQFSLRLWLQSRLSDRDAEVDLASAQTRFLAGGRHYSIDRSVTALPNEASREIRTAMETGLDESLRADHSPWQRRAEVLFQVAGELKQSPSAIVELTLNRQIAACALQAQAIIRASDDAAREVLNYALKTIDASLSLRNARYSDLLRCQTAPSLAPYFRREDLQHAVNRCLGDMGFDLSAGGRMTIDAEPRPGRDAGASVFELRVPQQIRLLLIPGAGIAAYSNWLNAWGQALHRAHVEAMRPFVERRAGDRSFIAAMGHWFQSFLCDPQWLKRYLRLTTAQAKDAVRLIAFSQLMTLRKNAAMTQIYATYLERGAGDAFGDHYATAMAQAWFCPPPSSRLWIDFDVTGSHVYSLDAASISASLTTYATGRFNEDFYRNPATGQWFKTVAAYGQTPNALQFLKALGAPDPSPQATVQQLILAMAP